MIVGIVLGGWVVVSCAAGLLWAVYFWPRGKKRVGGTPPADPRPTPTPQELANPWQEGRPH